MVGYATRGVSSDRRARAEDIFVDGKYFSDGGPVGGWRRGRRFFAAALYVDLPEIPSLRRGEAHVRCVR